SAQQIALAMLRRTTHARRRSFTSTIGAHRKYQTVGAPTVAPIVAMRPTGMPWRRRTYGSATATSPLKLPYGAAASAKSQGGGGERRLGLSGRRIQICDRPNSENPM